MHGVGDERTVHRNSLSAVVLEVLAHRNACFILGLHGRSDLTDEILVGLEGLILLVIQHTGNNCIVELVLSAGLDLHRTIGSSQREDSVVALRSELLDSGLLSSSVLEDLSVAELYVVVLRDVLFIILAEALSLFAAYVGYQNADLGFLAGIFLLGVGSRGICGAVVCLCLFLGAAACCEQGADHQKR